MRCIVSVGWWMVLGAALVSRACAQISQNEETPSPTTISARPCNMLTYRDDNHAEALCEGLHSLQEVKSNLASEQLPRVTTLTIVHANITSFTLDDLVDLPSLQTLIFNSSLVSNWQSPLLSQPPKVRILVLDRCWNNATIMMKENKPTLNLTSQMLSVAPALEELYICDCFLVNLEELDNVTSLRKLNIVDGELSCELNKLWILEWIEMDRASVSKNTTCYVPRDEVMTTWYSFKDREFLMCMGYRKETQRDCPKPCNCTVTGIKDSMLPIVHVKCQNVGLTELPQVPRYTTRAYLERNNITNMSSLFTNERYHHIDSILLDHNRITHMDGELFYKYVKNRSLDLGISLRHNRFTTMPVREMKRVYDEGVKHGESHLPFFYLGNNPWDCDDCRFIPEFQKLVYYQTNKDGKVSSFIDIRCAEWTSSAGRQVIKLDVEGLCAPDPPLLKPLDILNISMGILLLLLIFNFLHNFYHYRRHGKLPWIITKLPCC